MIIIPVQSGTYRHLRSRVADLLAESGLKKGHVFENLQADRVKLM